MAKNKPTDEVLYLEAAENGDVQKMKNLSSRDTFYHTTRTELEDEFQFDVMDKTALNKASKNGREKVVEYLLVEEQVNIEGNFSNDNPGCTPLHISANNGHLNVVKCLIGKGANIEAKDQGHLTPLHYAAIYGKLEVVKFLLQKGAKIDAKDAENWTPLLYAAVYGHAQVIKHLFQKGAKMNRKNR